MTIKRLSFLQQAENREKFFARIAMLFPTLDPQYRTIEKAYNASKDAFRDKSRETGERYFEHLRAVALILLVHLRVKDHELIVAAFLHDIVEDCPSWTTSRVQAEFGYDVALLVEWVTKPPTSKLCPKDIRNSIYNEHLLSSPRNVAMLKLADRLHNMITIGGCPKNKILRKVEETKRYYFPLAEKHCVLIHELEDAIARAEKSLKV